MLKLISTLDGVPDPLDEDSVLHVYDAFDINEIFNIIHEHGNPRYIINDHYSFLNIDLPGHYCIPFAAESISQEFCDDVVTVPLDTRHTFNFMINKKQINRHLCMKFVEIFGLKDYTHTWSGIGSNFDMSDIIKELDTANTGSIFDAKVRSSLLAPVNKIEKKFIDAPVADEDHSRGFVKNYGGNKHAWDNFLKNIFLDSAVSLITESVKFQKAAVFTEKTIFSVLGLTFPIWVGGYRQPDYWKDLGFDIFDDIIDHSYQDRKTLIERCYYAFFLNIDLLKNKQKTKEYREEYLPRLIKNRQLLINGQISSRIDQIIAALPLDLRDPAQEIRKRISKMVIGPINNSKAL